MEAPVGFLQIGNREMEVTLRGRERAVAEHFLHMAEAGAVADEMRGASVPPDVGGDVLFHPREPGILGDTAQIRFNSPRLGAEASAPAGRAAAPNPRDADHCGWCCFWRAFRDWG